MEIDKYRKNLESMLKLGELKSYAAGKCNAPNWADNDLIAAAEKWYINCQDAWTKLSIENKELNDTYKKFKKRQND